MVEDFIDSWRQTVARALRRGCPGAAPQARLPPSAPIDEVSQRDLQGWLNARKGAGRTKNNFRGLPGEPLPLRPGHGYLPSGLPTAAEGLSKAKEDSDEIGVSDCGRDAEVLKGAHRGDPLLAIGGFAGLRTAEIFRLDWEEVDFEQGQLKSNPGKQRRLQRRLAPLPPNLKTG